jgi:pteridine reductase
MMPLGNLPSPSGVADAVVYLAHANDVTGQIIFVDGGAHLKSFDRDFMYL